MTKPVNAPIQNADPGMGIRFQIPLTAEISAGFSWGSPTPAPPDFARGSGLAAWEVGCMRAWGPVGLLEGFEQEEVRKLAALEMAQIARGRGPTHVSVLDLGATISILDAVVGLARKIQVPKFSGHVHEFPLVSAILHEAGVARTLIERLARVPNLSVLNEALRIARKQGVLERWVLVLLNADSPRRKEDKGVEKLIETLSDVRFVLDGLPPNPEIRREIVAVQARELLGSLSPGVSRELTWRRQEERLLARCGELSSMLAHLEEQVSALSMACAVHERDKERITAERDHALMNLRMLQGKLVL